MIELGDREVAGVDGDIESLLERFLPAGFEVHADDRQRLSGGAGGEDRETFSNANIRNIGIGSFDGGQFLRGSIEPGQMPGAILGVATQDASGGGKAVGGHAEDPLGQAELGLHGIEGLEHGAVPAVEIPPAAGLHDEMKNAVGRPFGLEDGVRWGRR